MVVGRGGQVQCVLPGRDCRQIDALQVSSSKLETRLRGRQADRLKLCPGDAHSRVSLTNSTVYTNPTSQVPTTDGKITAATMKRAKEIMGGFVIPSADGSVRPPSVQPADTHNLDTGKLTIFFARPEEAEAAVRSS